MRRPEAQSGNPAQQVPWQGLLRKLGKTWALDQILPPILPHSGHPELLTTREGMVLQIATTRRAASGRMTSARRTGPVA